MFTKFTISHLSRSAASAFVASVTIVSLLFITFFLAEPAISHGQADTSGPFTVKQTITGESSFMVDATDVTMSGSISGLTGGQATGTTNFSVKSNNVNGYYVMINFADNVGDQAMLGENTGSEALRDYDPSITTPTFGYTASTAAQFAYTVTSDTDTDTHQNFLNNGAACGVGATETANTCWMSPASTTYPIVERDSESTGWATSTITFNVTVPNAANPVPVADTYTATVTLSLFEK